MEGSRLRRVGAKSRADVSARSDGYSVALEFPGGAQARQMAWEAKGHTNKANTVSLDMAGASGATAEMVIPGWAQPAYRALR